MVHYLGYYRFGGMMKDNTWFREENEFDRNFIRSCYRIMAKQAGHGCGGLFEPLEGKARFVYARYMIESIWRYDKIFDTTQLIREAGEIAHAYARTTAV